MTALLAGLPAGVLAGVPLARAPDPADVRPGWVALGLFLLLAAAVVFLAFSFRKRLRRTHEHFAAEESATGDEPNDKG